MRISSRAEGRRDIPEGDEEGRIEDRIRDYNKDDVWWIDVFLAGKEPKGRGRKRKGA